MQPHDDRKLFSLERAAVLLDMEDRLGYLRSLCRQKRIKAVSVGRRWYISAEELHTIIEEGIQ